jgi:hypothetical protein
MNGKHIPITDLCSAMTSIITLGLSDELGIQSVLIHLSKRKNDIQNWGVCSEASNPGHSVSPGTNSPV